MPNEKMVPEKAVSYKVRMGVWERDALGIPDYSGSGIYSKH